MNFGFIALFYKAVWYLSASWFSQIDTNWLGHLLERLKHWISWTSTLSSSPNIFWILLWILLRTLLILLLKVLTHINYSNLLVSLCHILAFISTISLWPYPVTYAFIPLFPPPLTHAFTSFIIVKFLVLIILLRNMNQTVLLAYFLF